MYLFKGKIARIGTNEFIITTNGYNSIEFGISDTTIVLSIKIMITLRL